MPKNVAGAQNFIVDRLTAAGERIEYGQLVRDMNAAGHGGAADQIETMKKAGMLKMSVVAARDDGNRPVNFLYVSLP